MKFCVRKSTPWYPTLCSPLSASCFHHPPPFAIATTFCVASPFVPLPDVEFVHLKTKIILHFYWRKNKIWVTISRTKFNWKHFTNRENWIWVGNKGRIVIHNTIIAFETWTKKQKTSWFSRVWQMKLKAHPRISTYEELHLLKSKWMEKLAKAND